jgi:hypothetical protein
MKKLYLFSTKNVTKKLLLANGAVCVAFGATLIAVILSLGQIEAVLTTALEEQSQQVVENAHVSGELTRIIGELNLLVTTFFGHQSFLDEKGGRLSRQEIGRAHV